MLGTLLTNDFKQSLKQSRPYGQNVSLLDGEILEVNEPPTFSVEREITFFLLPRYWLLWEKASTNSHLSRDQSVLMAAARELTTIPAQFEQTLSALPDKAAIFSGSESLSFQQLHLEAAAAAQALSSLGILAGDRVGICMQKNLDQVVAMLGVLWANAIFVPIHPVLHSEQIGHIVNDCDMKLLITDSTRITELRDAAHGRILVGHGPGRQ